MSRTTLSHSALPRPATKNSPPPACRACVAVLRGTSAAHVDADQLQAAKAHVAVCPRCAAEYRVARTSSTIASLVPAGAVTGGLDMLGRVRAAAVGSLRGREPAWSAVLATGVAITVVLSTWWPATAGEAPPRPDDFEPRLGASSAETPGSHLAVSASAGAAKARQVPVALRTQAAKSPATATSIARASAADQAGTVGAPSHDAGGPYTNRAGAGASRASRQGGTGVQHGGSPSDVVRDLGWPNHPGEPHDPPPPDNHDDRWGPDEGDEDDDGRVGDDGKDKPRKED